MTAFRRLLSDRQPARRSRRWLFVAYDQLSDAIGPLSRERPEDIGIVLIENSWQLSRRPYHKQKLAFLLANMRHFALEQASRGVEVRYLAADAPYRDVLPKLISELGPVRTMAPAERELRVDLQPLIAGGSVELVPHEGWLTTHEQFRAARPQGPPWRMDAFYRHVRRASGILMRAGRPRAGKFSFDASNRRAWRGTPALPEPPSFPLDPVKGEVAELIEADFRHHPGDLDVDGLAASQADMERLWSWAKKRCLPTFGPYQDAMTTGSTGLFHARISTLVNLHRLLPSRIVREAEGLRVPIESREAFIRQVLGWREFVRHVHLASDGFRHLLQGGVPAARRPGDGGYERWSGKRWPAPGQPGGGDGGAKPCELGCESPLPVAYWGRSSGLECLDLVVADVWRESWSHHITRLVVLGNIAALLDVSPRELADWFWIAYADAYDWVVEPNVLGMGTYAVGDYMSTKPYVTGAAYINRMSDYCTHCRFNPRKDCPLTSLYWAFLARHSEKLSRNARMALPVAAVRRRSAAQRRRDAAVFRRVREALEAGRALTPETTRA